MTTHLSAVEVAHRLLQAIALDRATPESALERLQAFNARFPDATLELLWEKADPLATPHYDVLLIAQDGGVTSLSYAPPGEPPWPLRGACRWNDKEIVRVEGEVLEIDRLLVLLDESDDVDYQRLTIDDCLIRQELKKRGIKVGNQALQAGLDRFRQRRGLNSIEKTHDWLRLHKIGHETLEAHIEASLGLSFLKESIANGREEEYFIEHRARFDRLAIAVATIETAADAVEVKARLASASPAAFDELLRRWFLEGHSGIRDVRLHHSRHWESGFENDPILGPVARKSGCALEVLLRRDPADFDEATKISCRERLFRDWLDERRVRATVEWQWGPASSCY